MQITYFSYALIAAAISGLNVSTVTVFILRDVALRVK
jgi:hypothetical protein